VAKIVETDVFDPRPGASSNVGEFVTESAIAPRLLASLMMLGALRVADAWDPLQPVDVGYPPAVL
jgi:hypothetical protein